MSNTPEAAAREVATHIANGHACQDAIQKALVEDIVDALLSFRRTALEDAAKVCERRIVITEHGERDIVLAEPSPEHAKSIRGLADSTKEGE